MTGHVCYWATTCRHPGQCDHGCIATDTLTAPHTHTTTPPGPVQAVSEPYRACCGLLWANGEYACTRPAGHTGLHADSIAGNTYPSGQSRH